jgi:hypothetical protein
MSGSHAFAFMDHVASINVSAHESIDRRTYPRRLTYGDRYESYTESDFVFAFNVAQTSLGAIGHLVGVSWD